MKICFMSFQYPPFIFSGAGVYAMYITKELAKLEHEVHIISAGTRTREDAHFTENNIFIHRIPIIHKRFLKAPSFWLKLPRKYDEVRKSAGEFDVLHNNAESDFSLSKRRAKELRVVTIHHLAQLVARRVHVFRRLLDLSGETGLAPLIQRVSIARAERIIAVSNFTKNSLVSKYGIAPSKVEVVPNGVNLDDYDFPEQEIAEFRQSLGLSDHLLFLFVGRLNDSRKNLPLLLRAYKILGKCKCGKPAKLLLVGHGDRSKVKKQVKSLGIERDVIILGYVDDVTLRKCYCGCDIVVSPSLLEGFGLTILEAAAAGKPVLALNRGAICEIIRDGVNGLLIDNQDPRELAAAMAFFVSHPDSAIDMGRRNRNFAKSFSWERSARATEHVYKSLLDSA